MLEEHSLSDLGCVVLDELHMIGDGSRGYLLELLLTKIRFAQKRSQRNVEDDSKMSDVDQTRDPPVEIQVVSSVICFVFLWFVHFKLVFRLGSQRSQILQHELFTFVTRNYPSLHEKLRKTRDKSLGGHPLENVRVATHPLKFQLGGWGGKSQNFSKFFRKNLENIRIFSKIFEDFGRFSKILEDFRKFSILVSRFSMISKFRWGQIFLGGGKKMPTPPPLTRFFIFFAVKSPTLSNRRKSQKCEVK